MNITSARWQASIASPARTGWNLQPRPSWETLRLIFWQQVKKQHLPPASKQHQAYLQVISPTAKKKHHLPPASEFPASSLYPSTMGSGPSDRWTEPACTASLCMPTCRPGRPRRAIDPIALRKKEPGFVWPRNRPYFDVCIL